MRARKSAELTAVRQFIKDDGRALPVDDRFLFAALSPTSPGTHYWDPPPPSALNDRQRARILLQTHQIVQVLEMAGVAIAGKHLMDIGTGNGMVPRLLLEISELDQATGVDPFLDGEHKTSWQPHDHDEELRALRRFIVERMRGTLDPKGYRQYLGHENYVVQPQPIAVPPGRSKQFRFHKIGAHDLARLDETFDLFYCKAIEHIPDWEGIFRAVADAARPGACFYLKHRPFFSYLGPHRYASTNVPWGHVLMTDGEYRRFAREFHAQRADKMIEFYFGGLAYPRYSVSDMLRIAAASGFSMRLLLIEPPRYLAEVARFIDDVAGFWQIKNSVYPQVSNEELFSGMYHIVLTKAA